ncbi:type II toxin-antitoxin system Phd/YefM family antitoxin [Geodermatophilus sp. DSM 44513]|uniref:type II toxin-antitoxin system Phd/YefM family antitoxin n=1 Tax=Geodermatophilus sp. DSM 44513 TaxID=1528104 RepID=UPI00128257E8|nr:type II toxin-antitoxin system prevent-host-death family antitoxin [Geodermatophilus sp. DSM 44513]WNV76866.1 type II toxin-antitoxin system prevent-host-death family antitoxin [Geodermatophilus sp. DSM 44513]
METISHREMRNNSAEVLRRVEAGETLLVTNHGRPVALLSPAPAPGVPRERYDELLQAGEVIPAHRRGWRQLPPPRDLPGPSTEDLLSEWHGDR